MSSKPPSASDSTTPEDPGFFESLKNKMGDEKNRSTARDIAALFTAISSDDVEAVTAMVRDKGQSLDVCNLIGVGALHHAVGHGKIKMVAALLELGASPDYMAGNGIDKMAPLDVAIEKNRVDMVRLLAASGADVSRRSSVGTSYLHLAARKNNPEMIGALLDLGADPRPVTPGEVTPLETAVNRRLLKAAARLLADGRVCAAAFTGAAQISPESLVAGGHPELAKIFLEAGMPVNHCNRDGVTALHVAAYNGYDFMVEQLLVAGADVRAATSEGNTPLHAVAAGMIVAPVGTAGLLLDAGADVDLKNGRGETALQLALSMVPFKADLAILLAKETSDINATTRAGSFPLHAAVTAGAGLAVIRALLARGADVNQAHACTGSTALHAAVAAGGHDCVEFLLDRGADPCRRDALGQTPLMLARRGGSQKIVARLEKHVTAWRTKKMEQARKDSGRERSV